MKKSRLRAKYAPDEREGTDEEKALHLTTRESFDIYGPDDFLCFVANEGREWDRDSRMRWLPDSEVAKLFDLLNMQEVIKEESRLHEFFTIYPKQKSDRWKETSHTTDTVVYREAPVRRWARNWMELPLLIEYRPKTDYYHKLFMNLVLGEEGRLKRQRLTLE